MFYPKRSKFARMVKLHAVYKLEIIHRSMSNIQEKIEQELANARQVCGTDGATSAECAAAWDAVEELQAAASHQQQSHPEQTSFEKYCADNPDAAECRLYDD